MSGKPPNYTLLPKGESDQFAVPDQRNNRRTIWRWALPTLLAIAVIFAFTSNIEEKDKHHDHHSEKSACPQYPALMSSIESKLQKEVLDEIHSPGFFNASIKRMQGAVQIPTESFDHMGKVGEDERWDIFVDFHKYLKETFPLV
jgi:Gly-Xaa carboxypeptidase